MNFLKEQNNGFIVLDSSMERLPIVEAWVNSSCVLWIKTAFPVAELFFKVGSTDGKSYIETVKACFHPSRGLFRAYIPGRCFTDHCETSYKILGKDEYDARTVFGEGKLRVYASCAEDINESNRVCFAYFPDEKWRKVTVGEDNLGSPIYEVSEETYDIVGATTDLYAYDRSKGLYFKVSGVFDSTGEPTLDVDQSPSEDGFECFVKDSKTGFFRRIDSFEDSALTESLATGKEII